MRWFIALAIILIGWEVIGQPSPERLLKDITVIRTAQVQYFSRVGHYAESMKDLGPAGAGLIDSDLASGDKDGYRFILAPTIPKYVLTVVGGDTTRMYFPNQEIQFR